jgi:hypothetical protein
MKKENIYHLKTGLNSLKRNKMKNIHVLPTDKPSRLIIQNSNRLILGVLDYAIIENRQHIYITSDEDLMIGDYYIAGVDIYQCLSSIELEDLSIDSYCKKIILTTDQDLIKDGVQVIEDEFLEWFIKNPSCEEVKVNKIYNDYGETDIFDLVCTPHFFKYKITIPQEEAAEYILINYFDEEFVELFNSLNISLGLINKYQLLDIQYQIAEKRLDGYYVMIKDLKCPIDNQGELQNWDNKTFDREYQMLLKLKQIQEKNE